MTGIRPIPRGREANGGMNMITSESVFISYPQWVTMNGITDGQLSQ